MFSLNVDYDDAQGDVLDDAHGDVLNDAHGDGYGVMFTSTYPSTFQQGAFLLAILLPLFPSLYGGY